jgi:hypothetical protein
MEVYSSYQKTKRYRVKGTSIFITLNWFYKCILYL